MMKSFILLLVCANAVSIGAFVTKFPKLSANDVEIRNKIIRAILNDDVRQTAHLLDRYNYNVNLPDDDGDVLLYYVKSRRMADLLLNRGADPNAYNIQGWTVFQQQVAKGNREIVERMIENGADVNLLDEDRWNALHWAAYGGSAPAAEAVIAAGVSLTLKNNQGQVPLETARYHDSKDVFETIWLALERQHEQD